MAKNGWELLIQVSDYRQSFIHILAYGSLRAGSYG